MPNSETARNWQIPFVNFAAQFAEERDEILAIVETVFARGDFIGGLEVGLLEQELAAYLGVPHVVALNSGTDALVLAMAALGIRPGDEVITPPNSFVASTAAIAHLGAVPVWVDVGDDLNIDPSLIEAAITPRTKAIMPVHLTGRMCDMDAIIRLASARGLKVIEDAAQAIGSEFDGRKAGAIGDAGCFSTHPLKNLNAAGDGGFVALRDGAVADRIRTMRNHGLRDRNTVEAFGFVSRMDTLQAAILRHRLRRLPGVIERRRANAQTYRRVLDPRHVAIPECRDREFNTFHLFVIETSDRDALKAHLESIGIGTSIHYPVPIHRQQAATRYRTAPGGYPVAERQARTMLSLPVNQSLGEAEITRVAQAINAFHAERAVRAGSAR
ncbi:MAG: DegT/DnrJ/EryC1/StrS family aminotransferase [Azospirillum sp.]|nr:DegT/DnrJ/EryC1/StrS family aminotransferase [Azospirillum sp.]